MIKKIGLAVLVLFLALTALKIFLSLLAVAFKIAFIVGLITIGVVVVKKIKSAN